MKKTLTNNIFLLFFLFVFVFPLRVQALEMVDADFDGLTDQEEREYYGTNPLSVDTDGDGFNDKKEIESGYSPHFAQGARMSTTDFDKDGLVDALEIKFSTSLTKNDTDNDTYSDLDEILYGYDPTSQGTANRLLRSIVVDRTTQKLWYLVNGQKMKEFPVSTGNPKTPTPTGEFSIQKKREYVDYRGADYNYPHIRWNLQFLPHYYLHTATWHNDFGIRTRSHGCVNMRESDAAFLFKYVDVGVPITVTGTTPMRLYVGK